MAFWFKSKDSVSRVAVPRLLSLVLMGAYFFSSYHCIPITKAAVDDTPWWCQPCQKQHRTRHSRGITDPLKDQFRTAIINYDNIISKYVTQLRTKLQIGNMAKKQFKNNTWLPRKKFFRMLQKNNEKILPDLLHQIQIYAVTFDRLAKMEIRSQDASFNAAERNEALQHIKDDINLLRCETEHEIAEKQLQKLKEVQSNYVHKFIPEAVDHLTDGLLRDLSILKDYHNFLKKCFNKIFGKAKKNQKKNKGDKQKSKKRTPKPNKPKTNKKVSES